MGRLAIALTLATCFAWSASSAEPAASAFADAWKRGLYREADVIASEQLAAVSSPPDFRQAEIRARYFNAIKAADLWARWKEAESLLQALAQGMQQGVPQTDADWIELGSISVQLYSSMADYARADRAYGDGRRIAAAAKLEQTPAFEGLLRVQATSLQDQQRWWEATMLLEEHVRWLEAHSPRDPILLGHGLISLAKLTQDPYRPEARDAYFGKALRILEPAYRSGKPTRSAATQAMALWAFNNVYTRDYEKWDECKLRAEWIEATENEFGATNAEMVEPLTEAASYCEEEITGSALEQMFARALEISRDVWGEEHPNTVYVLDHQGIYYASREYSERMNEQGDRILARMVALRTRAYRDAPLMLAADLVYDISNEPPEACEQFATGHCRSQLDAALDSLAGAWGDTHPALAEVRGYLATRLDGWGETEADDEVLYAYVDSQHRLAVDSATASLGADHPQTGRLAEQYAAFLLSYEKHEQARELLESAASAYTEHFGRRAAATTKVLEDLEYLKAVGAR